MMTKGTMTLTEETKKFNHVVDLFFGMNPEKRLWILLMLYLGKERVLHIVDNTEVETYAQNHSCNEPYWHVMAKLSIEDINSQTKRTQWSKDGISSRFIWADTPKFLDCTLDELVYGLDIDSHNVNQSNETNYNIFNRHRWEPIYLMEIAETFISLSDEWYKENAPLAFNYILKRIQNAYGMHSGLFYQPVEITNLVGKLLNAQEGSVCNPFAGVASYSNVIGENCTYVGQEFSHSSTYVAKLFLLINNKRNATIERGNPDSILEDTTRVYDYFVSTPPFGLRIPNLQYRTAELYYLDQSAHLAKNKSVGIYPSSICYNSTTSNRQVLAKLVEEDILDTVILLPTNLFSNTSIETAIIVVNKNKQQTGRVRFVDASDCYMSEGRLNRLDLEKVFDKLDNNDNQPGVLMVSLDEIRKNDYKVYPKFYCSLEEVIFPDGYVIAELGDIIEPCPSTRRYNETSGHLAKIGELSNDTLDCVRSVDNFEASDNLANAAKVTEPVILFSMIRDIKPTFCIASQDMPLYVHPNVSAYRIKPNCNWVSAKYLCFELGRRANNVTSGVIPRISREVLLKTRIGFPSNNVEDQELIVKEALQQSKLAKAKELGLQEVIDIMKADYINEVRTRKHDMRPYLRELGSVERMMRKYISDNDSEPEYQQKMFNLLDKYHEALNHLSDLIDIFSEEEQFGKPVVFNLDKYFSELMDNQDSESSGFEISYERDENALNEVGMLNNQIAGKEISILNGLVSLKYEAYKDVDVYPLFIDIAPVDFERLVSNIIENARKHGFTNPSESFYELKISLSIDAKRGMYQIDFINNGTPLPTGVDKKRFGIRGEKAGITGGTGKGGYIIKSIAEHYKGDYDIFMDEEKTVVRIFLPIAKQNDEQEV